MDDYVVKTIKAYDTDSQKYINSTKKLILHQEIETLTKGMPKSGLILDAGCGFGRDTKVFIDRGFKVIGIDLSEKLLEIAKINIPQAKFIKMDLRILDFPDNYFDAIWCNAALLHLSIEDIKKALDEFYRVLKHGGKLFVSFKKGEGSREFVETFSSNSSRFFTFLTKETLDNLLKNSKIEPINSYYVNEKERFGQDKRDLEWLYSFSQKA